MEGSCPNAALTNHSNIQSDEGEGFITEGAISFEGMEEE